MIEKLLVPDIGEFENVEVIELLVKEGQLIKKNDPIITIESDKSSVEIPSTIEGKIEKVIIKIGDKVSKGDLLLTVLNEETSSNASEDVPKNTENLIQEAETSLQKSQGKIVKDLVTQPKENEKKKAVNATKREHEKKIDDIKNDKIKKSLLELSKIFKPK